MRDSILLIDDDEQLIDVLSVSLDAWGYDVASYCNPVSAIAAMSRQRFSLILLDLRLGDCNGIDLVPRFREIDPEVPIFMITAHGDVDSAVDAFMLGVNGYIRKPFQEGLLKKQIAEAIEGYRLRLEMSHRELAPEDSKARLIVRSRDPVMDPLLKRIEIAAQVGSNVVITGESGTGKELVAKALHLCGPRKNSSFVAFNCAALPEALLESELFGYVRGAFTDARESKPGLFARAHGGTLFLDEIGDAPLSIQTKLLRVLQEREVLPLGATQSIRIDVRVVAATNRLLEKEVAKGRFRQDLYYRLHVIPIHLPSLRERPKDIIFLASLFAARLAEEMGFEFQGFTSVGEQELQAYSWPGNVRELQNRVEHAIVIRRGGKLTAKSLFPERSFETENVQETQDAQEMQECMGLPTFSEAKISFERSYLEKLLQAAKGNIALAARLSSKSRTEVYSLIRKHRLDPLAFKDARGGENASSG